MNSYYEKITRRDLYQLTFCILLLFILSLPRINLHIFFVNYWKSFLDYQPLPDLMQGGGTAILTLLMSFAIGIFIHHLGDGEKRGNFLDLRIALDYVWRFKSSLFFTVVLVLSPFLMGFDNLIFKTFVFIIWMTTFFKLTIVLLRLYDWVKGEKDTFWLKYFSEFSKSSKDLIVSWGDFWELDTNLNKGFFEKDFFLVFSREIDNLIKLDKKESWGILSKLLEDFANKIEKRNKVFILVFPEFFPKILEWHYVIWEKQYTDFSKDKDIKKTKLDYHFFEVDISIDKIIKFVTKEALSGNSRNAYSYFNTLNNHIESYKDKKIAGENNEYYYIEQIPIYEDCFNLIPESSESYDIWNHYFPNSWKIAVGSFEKSQVSFLWYRRFLDWSQSRIWKEGEKWDKAFDDILRELFFEVDPIIWAKIYTFVLMPWSNSRIKETVERKLNYGYVSRIFSGFGDDIESTFANEQEIQIKKSLELAVYLFGKIFTIGNIDKWLEELNQLKYPEDSKYFLNQKSWEGIFMSLRKIVLQK